MSVAIVLMPNFNDSVKFIWLIQWSGSTETKVGIISVHFDSANIDYLIFLTAGTLFSVRRSLSFLDWLAENFLT